MFDYIGNLGLDFKELCSSGKISNFFEFVQYKNDHHEHLTLFRPPLEHFHPSLQRHNSLANSVKELFKSSTDSASLLVSIKKNYFIWVRGSLGGMSQIGGVF